MLSLALCAYQPAEAETLAQVVNPKKARNSWVSDMARVIDSSGERRLNSLIDRLEQRTTAEIAVATIHRSDGHAPKEFATRLFNLWKIGKKGKDNGYGSAPHRSRNRKRHWRHFARLPRAGDSG
jgi:uncharacterized protein